MGIFDSSLKMGMTMENKMAPKEQVKKTYSSPQLTVYGNVGQITMKKVGTADRSRS